MSVASARLEAIRTLIAVASGSLPKPRPAELELLLARAKAGIDDLQFYYDHRDDIRSLAGHRDIRKGVG
jgi:hypothetical protein